MCEIQPCIPEGKSNLKAEPEARRQFLKGLASLPIAYVLADVQLLHAAAEMGKKLTIDGPGGPVSGHLAMPESPDNAPVVLLIHEWWGLNDNIKSMANDLAAQGYIALAVDLYDGEVASDRDGAMKLVRAVDAQRSSDIMDAWVRWARTQGNGKVASLGWCFGGAWSLQTALKSAPDASVIYYGRLDASVDRLANLNTPMLGHFGTLDRGINADMVGGFQRMLDEAGKGDLLTTHWYTANHAFANPTGARYDEDDAALAWTRTLTFLAKHLKG